MINIDKIDKKILFELEKNARIPDVKLARIIGKSKDTVRYRIKRLEKLKVITGYRTWIDIARLGYRASTIYLKILNLPEEKKKLINDILNDKRVYWFGIAEGVWNIGITFFIKSNDELFNIKNSILSKYDNLIIDSIITDLVNVSVHEKIFLVKEKSSLITFTEDFEKIEIDEIDKKVLSELYTDSRANLAYIAYKNKTSVDIVRNRIKKLEKLRIIIRYTICLDYQQLGYEFYKSFIYLNSHDDQEIKSMLKYAEQSDKIINMVKQVAPWDFEFIIFARSFKEYNDTISELTEKFPKNIKKIESATMSLDVIFPCKKLIFE
jgi:DNA-binding Lrp family transcriptional regulator